MIMKKLQYVLVLAATTLLVAGCADSYLDQYPAGSSITEDQYKNMDDVVSGTAKGVYPLIYAYGGDHDWFGQRSIDMYGDLLCGDMAMKNFNYSWFATDELGQTYTRRGSLWYFYYDIIRACNKGINAIEMVGLPELTYSLDTITYDQVMNGMYYAEMLTMRGWAYAALCRFFVATDADPASLSIPIYTEADTRQDTIIGGPRATVADLYLRIEQDLLEGIQYFDAYDVVERSSKIEVNIDVARILLAYSYLNKGDNKNALKYAEEAITEGKPHILPQAEVLTTGFNNVANENWIWGEEVTVQNTTSLASFFGQCDIYSYSYASAGSVKGVDKNLYDAIQAWDIRKNWWSNYAKSGKQGAKNYEYAPDGKFYSAKSKTLQGDRDWLSDNVFMRWELAYLIAAEAAARQNDFTNAKAYLFDITDQRCDTAAANVTAYQTWKDNMADGDVLAAIKHNWRVELWGEGYGLQTFRRYGETVTLGENHRRSKKDISPSTPRVFTFEIPTSEEYYNPFIRATEDTKNLRQKD